MSKQQKQLKQKQTFRLYPELSDDLKQMSKETDIAMNRIVERALENYISEYKKRKEK